MPKILSRFRYDQLLLIERAFELRWYDDDIEGYVLPDDFTNDADAFIGLTAVFDEMEKLDPDYFRTEPIRLTPEGPVLEDLIHV